jgi:hypothetical protein
MIGKSLKPECFEIVKIDSLEKTEEHVHNLKDMLRIWRPRGEKEESTQAKRREHFSIGSTEPSIHKHTNSLGWKISSIWMENVIAIKHVVSKLFAVHPTFSVHTVGARKFLEVIVPKRSDCQVHILDEIT